MNNETITLENKFCKVTLLESNFNKLNFKESASVDRKISTILHRPSLIQTLEITGDLEELKKIRVMPWESKAGRGDCNFITMYGSLANFRDNLAKPKVKLYVPEVEATVTFYMESFKDINDPDVDLGVEVLKIFNKGYIFSMCKDDGTVENYFTFGDFMDRTLGKIRDNNITGDESFSRLFFSPTEKVKPIKEIQEKFDEFINKGNK